VGSGRLTSEKRGSVGGEEARKAQGGKKGVGILFSEKKERRKITGERKRKERARTFSRGKKRSKERGRKTFPQGGGGGNAGFP